MTRLVPLLALALLAACDGTNTAGATKRPSTATSSSTGASNGSGTSAGTTGGTAGGTTGGTTGGTGGTTGGPIPGSFAAQCNGAETSFTGTVTMPNGTDPVSGAVVAVVTDVQPLATGVLCEKCGQTSNATLVASTLTGVDGKFSFSLDNVPASATVQVMVQKARFRKVTTVPVTACQANALTAPVTTLPGHAADGDVPAIAVTSGNSDHLSKVLDALGIEYTCVHNANNQSDSCVSATLTLDQLLKDPTQLNSYAMLFISCSVSSGAQPDLSDPTVLANLQGYVAAGGKVIVTDDSYDYVEQPFPDAIDFMPTTTDPTTPQPLDAAQIGTGGLHVDATINDQALQQWMSQLGALNGDGTVHITGFLSNWAVMGSVDAKTNVLVTGNVSWSGGSGSQPLTVEFTRNDCGRVIFSSYHTSGTSSSTGLLPQERILEYLMVEVGTCVTPR
jgi:hypothetical protein